MFSKSGVFYIVAYIVVFILVLSFGLHIIMSDHYHPEALFGVGVEALIHGEDRKWILFLLLAFITPVFYIYSQKAYISIRPFTQTFLKFTEIIIKTSLIKDISTKKGIIQNVVYG